MTYERAKCYFQNLEVKWELSQDEEQYFPREKPRKTKSINVCEVSQRKTLRFESHVSFELHSAEMQIPIQTNNEADKDLWMNI